MTWHRTDQKNHFFSIESSRNCFQDWNYELIKPLWNESLRWRHNEPDSVSNHQHHDYLLKRLFRRRSKKTSKLRVTGLCAENSPEAGEFPAQMARCAENVSIWWRHHVPGAQVWWNMNPMVIVIRRYKAYTDDDRYTYSQNKLIKPLYVLHFQLKHEYVFTIPIIPPHWHDTSCWNPSLDKDLYILKVIIMGADVLAMQGARASATMILT